MPTVDQVITDRYALYNADCIQTMQTMPDACIHLSAYSPPFGGLYTYSSDERDLSNALDRDEFFEHYAYVVRELHRLTLPGRMTLVHTMDIPSGNSGLDHLYDFPGDVIRLHESLGWHLTARYMIWKEPLMVRNRTMTKSLSHKALTEDSTQTSIANADQLLAFRRSGVNKIPVTHTEGLDYYAGSQHIPNDILQYRHWTGSQLENKYSHWIWRQYASSVWMDVRIDRVLPFREAKDEEDTKHVHPLQLDVIDRGVLLFSNPGETVLSPFAGVGSEPYSAVTLGRKGIGIELKRSYWTQAVKNLEHAVQTVHNEQEPLFAVPALGA